ncbi:MAG TPA: hypothetical protein VF064_00170 [Pyrinomonadaceae bacterium]
MKPLNGFHRAHTWWVVFLGHQAFLFATAVGFLHSVRRLTGRAVLSGRDPLGVLDGAALVAGFPASGLWHAGAVVEVVFERVAPNRVAVALMPATVAALFALLKRKHDSTKNRPRAAGRRA